MTLSRRRFLRTTLTGTVLLGGAALLGRSLTGYDVGPEIARKLQVLSAKEYLVLQAVTRRMLAPDRPDAPTADSLEVALFVDRYLAGLESGLQSDVRSLLQLVEHGSGLFRFSVTRFTRMAAEEQDRTLLDWQTSRLAVRRQGFQALKTMCLLGYYRDDRTWPMIGYSGPMLPARVHRGP